MENMGKKNKLKSENLGKICQKNKLKSEKIRKIIKLVKIDSVTKMTFFLKTTGK